MGPEGLRARGASGVRLVGVGGPSGRICDRSLAGWVSRPGGRVIWAGCGAGGFNAPSREGFGKTYG